MDRSALLRILPLRNVEMWITKGRQTIPMIMNEVIDAHEYYKKDYDLLAEYFDQRDLSKTFRDLFNTCKQNLTYREEKEKMQQTKSPAWIIKDAVGDCKHYASFIGGVLGALQRYGRKFDWGFCFASYDKYDEMPGHVFIMAEWNGTWYWIDPVLATFDNRFKPEHKIFKRPKSSTMALRRVGAIIDTPQQVEVLDMATSTMDPALLSAIKILYRYNVLNDRGQISDKKLLSYSGKIGQGEYQRLAQARIYLQKASINGLFDSIWRGIKKVTLALPRNAYLSLVAINAFGYATKLKAALWDKNGNYTAFKDQIKKIWQDRLGGDWTNLENTIKRGMVKKAILKGTTIGVAPAIPAWVVTASAVVAAIMPLVNAFLKKSQTDPNFMLDQNMYPYGLCADGITPRNADGTCAAGGGSSAGTGIIAWAEQNPVVTVAALGGAFYLLTKKK